MSLADQCRRLGRDAARMRQAMWGTERDGTKVELDYDNGTWFVPGYYAPIRFDHELEGLNLRETHEAVVRIAKPAPFTPQHGKKIRIAKLGLTLKIVEVAPDHPASVEWVLGVNGLNNAR